MGSKQRRRHAEVATGLMRKAIATEGSVNPAVADVPARGCKCRYTRTTGCTEDHAAASCKAFCNLDQEAKKRVVEDSRVCGFCISHRADAECFGKGTASKPACKVPQCKGQHAESLHEMMASAKLTVNSLANEEDEEEGYVNLARGDHG